MKTVNTMKTKTLLAAATVALTLVFNNDTASAFYDASMGRWINRDPVREMGFEPSKSNSTAMQEGGPNLYAFVDNNPLSNVDPLGLVVIWPFPGWNTPPGAACDAYNCSPTLKAICNGGGNDAWANCVRGCLLADWNPNTCSYASGGAFRHLYCWCRCAVQPPNPGRIP